MSNIDKSQLINENEHKRLVSMIEPKCSILSCTVARLYQAHSSEWRYECTGVLALTKNSLRKKYLLEIYNMETLSKSWDLVISINFNYNVYKKQIHTFTADNVATLLSFASSEESTKFYDELMKLQNQRKEQKDAKKRQSQENSQNASMVMSVNDKKLNVTQQPKVIQGKKGKGIKISKSDISNPTDFKHVDHMGLHDHFFQNPEDESLRNCLKDANMEYLLENDETKREIYEFIEQRGGLTKLDNEIKEKQQYQMRKAPPVPQKVPPPPPGRAPNVAPTNQNSYKPPPPGPVAPPPTGHMAPPPPPIGSAVPPPPPPPPAPGPPRINIGAKPATHFNIPPPQPGKGGLLSEIEKFDAKKLKARSQPENEEPPPPAAGGSLLDSLAQYLVQRKTLLTGTSDSEDDDNEDDDDEWKD